MSINKKLLYIDFDSAKIIDNEGAIIMSRPSISFGAAPDWELHFCRINDDGTLSGADLSEAVSWSAAVDTDFLSSTLPMIRTLPSGINTDQAASGVITVSLDANTETFFSKVEGKNTVPAYFEVRGRDSEDKVVYDYRFNVNALGAIDPQGGSPLPVVSGGVTMADVYALLRSATEYQFSDDGVEWHTPQREGDIYYQSRYPQGEWSDPIELVKGTDGADGYNVKFEYSVNGTSNWHTPATSADFYMRTSSDNGEHWTVGLLFKGTNGVGYKILGAYNSSTTYNPYTASGYYECVTYEGSTYAYTANTASSGNLPTNTAYWTLIAAKGDTGSVEDVTTAQITDLDSYMSGQLSGYQKAGTSYTTAQIDNMMSAKANLADVYTKTEADELFVDIDEINSITGTFVQVEQWSSKNSEFQAEINYLSGQISGGGGGDLSNYTPLSTTQSVSAYLQNEINNIPTPGSLDNYTPLSTTQAISSYLQTEINNISGGGGYAITGGISGVALNGTNLDVNNGYVNVQALPMATTMTSGMLYSQEFLFYLGPNVDGDTYRGNLASVDFNEPEMAVTGLIQFTQQGGPDTSGTSRYWQYGSGMDRYYKISYDTDHWKIARQDTTGGDPGPAGWTDCGTLVTAFISGQPWGIYNIMNTALSSSYHNIYPVNCYAAANKGHLYERIGSYDDDAITIHAYNLTFTVLKYSANQWYTNRDPYDHTWLPIYARLQWEGTDTGNWTLYLVHRYQDAHEYSFIDEITFTSPTGGYAPTPWIYSGQPWNWHDDTGTMTGIENIILTQAAFAGGWSDLGSMLN